MLFLQKKCIAGCKWSLLIDKVPAINTWSVIKAALKVLKMIDRQIDSYSTESERMLKSETFQTLTAT